MPTTTTLATTVLFWAATTWFLPGSTGWISLRLRDPLARVLSISATIPTTKRKTWTLQRMTTTSLPSHWDGVLYWTEQAVDDPIFPNMIAPRLESIRMIVFDKDGTLGDDKASLRRWTQKMTENLQLEWEKLPPFKKSNVNIDIILSDFYQRIGWDPSAQNVIPSAPLAAGTWQDQVFTLSKLLVDYHLVGSDQSTSHDTDDGALMIVTAAKAKAQEWQDALSTLHGCDPPLVDNLPELLSYLSVECGWKVAICTSDDRGSTDAALEHWNVKDMIQHSICGDEVTESKPSAQPLHLLCQQAGLSTSQCLVVGDTTSDTGMASNAGAGLCFGVLTGSGSAKQLSETGARVILQSVAHLPALLQAANARWRPRSTHFARTASAAISMEDHVADENVTTDDQRSPVSPRRVPPIPT